MVVLLNIRINKNFEKVDMPQKPLIEPKEKIFVARTIDISMLQNI